MKRFAGSNLGCCAKCAVQVVDKDKNPIAGLGIKLLAKGKEVYRGVTDAFGSSPFVGGCSVCKWYGSSHAVHPPVAVERVGTTDSTACPGST